MSDLNEAYKVWLNGRFPSTELQEEFLEHRRLLDQVQKDVNEWPRKHPECSVQNPRNKILFDKYLDTRDLPATMDNLEEAYDHLKRAGNLELIKIEPPIDPDKPQTGFIQWKNGQPRYGDSGGTRADKSHLIGQVDPSKEASGEKTISKRISQMTSAEFQRNLEESPSFRKKVDGLK